MVEKVDIVGEGETKTPPEPVKKKKNRWLTIVLDAFLVTAFVVSVAISSNVICLSARFGYSFYVNGMSMYPTLNGEGLRKDNGKYRPFTWNDSENQNDDIVDFGYGKDNSKDWTNDLYRYDIVITYYADDYDASGRLKDSARLKIKRIIGFPGESVRLVNDGTAWGKTTIIKDGVESEPLPNLYEAEDFPSLPSRNYPALKVGTGFWTLGENEFFVMGDNRGGNNSADSRTKGPVKLSYMQGKAYVITAMKRFYFDKNHNGQAKFLLKYAKMPWNYIDLTKDHLDKWEK